MYLVSFNHCMWLCFIIISSIRVVMMELWVAAMRWYVCYVYPSGNKSDPADLKKPPKKQKLFPSPSIPSSIYQCQCVQSSCALKQWILLHVLYKWTFKTLKYEYIAVSLNPTAVFDRVRGKPGQQCTGEAKKPIYIRSLSQPVWL